MKNKNMNFFVYLHGILLLWAVLFLICLSIPALRGMLDFLGWGNLLFLFVNIPFSLVSLVLKAKGRFSRKYGIPIVVLSLLNTVVGIMVWWFVVLLFQMP